MLIWRKVTNKIKSKNTKEKPNSMRQTSFTLALDRLFRRLLKTNLPEIQTSYADDRMFIGLLKNAEVHYRTMIGQKAFSDLALLLHMLRILFQKQFL